MSSPLLTVLFCGWSCSAAQHMRGYWEDIHISGWWHQDSLSQKAEIQAAQGYEAPFFCFMRSSLFVWECDIKEWSESPFLAKLIWHLFNWPSLTVSFQCCTAACDIHVVSLMIFAGCGFYLTILFTLAVYISLSPAFAFKSPPEDFLFTLLEPMWLSYVALLFQVPGTPYFCPVLCCWRPVSDVRADLLNPIRASALSNMSLDKLVYVATRCGPNTKLKDKASTNQSNPYATCLTTLYNALHWKRSRAR